MRNEANYRDWRAKNREKLLAQQKAWLKNNPERAKQIARKTYLNRKDKLDNTRLLAEYNLSLEQYDAMLLAQGGVCAICGEKNRSGRKLGVDHCHSTGIVRGILCYRCNVGIGALQDDPEVTAKATSYLLESSAYKVKCLIG